MEYRDNVHMEVDMKRVLLRVVVISAVLSLIISCASGPEPEETTVSKKEPAVQEEEPVQITETQEETEVKESPQPTEEAVEEPEEITQWSGIDAEEEPNNSPGEANPVEFGKAFTMKIQTKGDNDWYKLPVKEQGYIRLMAKNVPDSLGLQARYGTWDEWEEEFTEIRGWHGLPDACAVVSGEVYIQIHDDWDDAAASQEITMRMDFLPEMDTAERNNSPKTAAEFTPGSSTKMAIFPVGDSDWFKVPIKEQGYLQVITRGVPDGIGLQVRYGTWDEWDNEFTVLRDWKYLPDAFAAVEGEVYVQFIDDWNDGGSPELFDMKMDFLPEMDPGEPNDSPKEATEFEAGSTTKMAIYPVGDRDWYKVSVPEQGYLQVITRGVPDGVAPQVRYGTYDEWDDELMVIRDWKYMPDGCAVTEGDVYLQFVDDWNDGGNQELFDLKIDFTAEFDPGEPNNSPAEATEAAIGDTVTPAIYPMGDSDWYKVSVPGPGSITLSATDVPEDLGLQAAFYTYDQWSEEEKTLQGWKYFPTSCTVEGGDVYIRLIDDWNDAGVAENFKIKFEFTSN